MIYETINQFIKTAKTSRSSIYRFYKKNDGLWEETKMKGNKRLLPTAHAKHFDSEALFDELKTAKLSWGHIVAGIDGSQDNLAKAIIMAASVNILSNN